MAALRIITVLLALATLPVQRWWLADIAGNLRLHLLVACMIASVALVLLRCGRSAAVCVIASVIHAVAAAVPYAQTAPVVSAENRPVISILAYNMHRDNTRHDAVEAMLRQQEADMVVLFEARDDTLRYLQPRLAAMYPHSFPKTIAENRNGIALFSRHPWKNLSFPDFPEAGRFYTQWQLVQDGEKLTVLAVHTQSALNKENLNRRNRQFAALAAYAASRLSGERFILLGDVNASPWSGGFQEFVAASGMRPAWPCGGLGYSSWPAALPPLLGIPIDHLFVSDGLAVKECRTGAAAGSDHRPVRYELMLTTTPGD